MRLLLDQHLSWRLVAAWDEVFPGSAHVRTFDMSEADDSELWSFAQGRGYVIITKDHDFDDALKHPGPPPKVIRLSIGNASTADIDRHVRASLSQIVSFEVDEDRCLAI
jgi:predicted nuclease of predicted toxin-antitoxin system